IKLRHDLPEAHFNLGNALIGQGKPKEAEACYREFIRLKPDLPEAHYALGLALNRQGRHREAEAAYPEAIRLKTGYAEAHCNLGFALRNQGKFSEAVQALRTGHALGSKRPGWPYPSAEWALQAELLAELDRILPAIRAGQAEPASAEDGLAFA